MNSTLKQYYQDEWENDPFLTIAELAKKYAFEPEELGDTSDWVKVNAPANLPTVHAEVLPAKSEDSSKSPVQQDIGTFKSQAIKECLIRLRTASMMDTKELKDLVTTVDIIDRSLKTNDSHQNVNVLIQNIINKYGDDC